MKVNYIFPPIYTINDVLPAIEGCSEFIVVEKDDYTVINYAVAYDDSFPPVITKEDAIRRECRGLIFDKEGRIISRPYHKFFNVNEREETMINKVDLNQSHVIFEKLDGSMCRPVNLDGNIRWMTKMGITDVSMQAEIFVATHPEYQEFAKNCIEQNITPIFEWCSNKNRIVVDFPEDQLILTACRHNYTGRYLSIPVPEEIPIVSIKSVGTTIDEIIKNVHQQMGDEGIVIRFDSGEMLKVKCEWYVRIHKAKDLIFDEHKVCKQIIENTIDDVKPFLLESDYEKIIRYEQLLESTIKEFVSMMAGDMHVMRDIEQTSRKDFALAAQKNNYDKIVTALTFECWDDYSLSHINRAVLKKILKNCNKKKDFEEMKESLLQGVEYI